VVALHGRGSVREGQRGAVTAPAPGEAATKTPQAVPSAAVVPGASPAHETATDMTAPEAFSWPTDLPHARSAALAYADLLQRWGVAATAAVPACGGGLPNGLHCARGRAGLAELKALGLPVILHLDDDRGHRVDAVLSRLDGADLVVDVAGVSRRWSVAGLREGWHGDYTVVWRAPFGAGDLLSSGSRGPAVAWLRERLAGWQGAGAPVGAAASFDAALGRQVREFQMSEGIEPDGIVGLRTMVRLVARTDPMAPTLGPTFGPMRPQG